jgi:hypothetical protein
MFRIETTHHRALQDKIEGMMQLYAKHVVLRAQ